MNSFTHQILCGPPKYLKVAWWSKKKNQRDHCYQVGHGLFSSIGQQRMHRWIHCMWKTRMAVNGGSRFELRRGSPRTCVHTSQVSCRFSTSIQFLNRWFFQTHYWAFLHLLTFDPFHSPSSTGSGGVFVYMTLLERHPIFFCSICQDLQKKFG